MKDVFTSMSFGLWAVIDDKTEVDLVQFNCTYEMNTIPTCTAMLPVGYRVLPGYSVSTAHEITSGVQLQIPMKVFCRIALNSGSQLKSAPAPGVYTLFEGYVTGVGYRRTYDGYSMTIEGTHWLSDLNYSSILSATSNPGNPTQFSFNAALNLGAGGGPGQELGLPAGLSQDYATEANIKENLWGSTMKPWLLELAGTDRIGADLLEILGQDAANDTGNGDVATALGRIEGTLPFVTDKFSSGGDVAATMISQDLDCTVQPTSNIQDSLAQQTFWDKIVGQYVPTYMFSLIPYPTKAEMQPFIPGLRAVWDPGGETYTFKGRDIEVQDMNCILPRALRGVGIFGGYGSKCGGFFPDDSGQVTVVGMFVPEGVETGMIIMRECPSFLWTAEIPFEYTDQITKPRGNAFNNGGGGAAPAAKKNRKKVKEDVKVMLNLVAQATYVNEILKNRYGDISSPLRFDVAPGSSVMIEGTSGQFMSDGEDRYGQVLRVSHQFDAQQQRAGSQFRIGYMHTAAEHELDQFTIDSHPFYTTTWPGAKHITP